MNCPTGIGLQSCVMLLSVAATVVFGSPVDGAPLKVMSFNIRGDFDLEKATNSPEAWNSLSENHRRDLVIKTIANVDPDIFGVQEAFQHQLADLKHGLPGYEFSGVGREDGKHAGEHSAIFYRTDRFGRLNEGTFWLSNSPDVPGSMFPGAACVRIASWVILTDKQSGGKELFVLNTHWDHISITARQHSANLIRERIKSLAGGRPVVVMGDLNDSEDSAPVKSLLDTESAELPLYDSFREVFPPRGNDEASFHDFGGETAGSRIDFILHNRDLKATDAGIVHTNFDGRYPSDHFPVTTVLEFVE
jgi:endonuclease/exonuclease/phosphatase family metal-dependent hydrolase